MDVEVLSDRKDQLVLKLHGLDHTFCNHLKRELYMDGAVKEATYKVDHPLIGTPEFLVHTDGKKAPRSALKDACKRIKDQNKEFLKGFKKR